MRKIALSVATAAVFAPLLPTPAHAATRGLVPLNLGTTRYVPLGVGSHDMGSVVIHGRKVRITTVVGPSLRRAAPRGTAFSLSPNACWVQHNQVYYGPAWSKDGQLNQDVNWCGDGNVITSQNQIVWAWVPAYNRFTGFFLAQAILYQNMGVWYNGWAGKAYVQGHFNTCVVVRFACTADRYPQLATIIYANGDRRILSSR